MEKKKTTLRSFYKDNMKMVSQKLKKIEIDIKQISEMIKEQDQEPTTAMQKLLEGLHNDTEFESCEEKINEVLRKAFELLTDEKEQSIDFFIAGYTYAVNKNLEE